MRWQFPLEFELPRHLKRDTTTPSPRWSNLSHPEYASISISRAHKSNETMRQEHPIEQRQRWRYLLLSFEQFILSLSLFDVFGRFSSKTYRLFQPYNKISAPSLINIPKSIHALYTCLLFYLPPIHFYISLLFSSIANRRKSYWCQSTISSW